MTTYQCLGLAFMWEEGEMDIKGAAPTYSGNLPGKRPACQFAGACPSEAGRNQPPQSGAGFPTNPAAPTRAGSTRSPFVGLAALKRTMQSCLTAPSPLPTQPMWSKAHRHRLAVPAACRPLPRAQRGTEIVIALAELPGKAVTSSL